jgi:SNF2 family DNA or RNA helicase
LESKHSAVNRGKIVENYKKSTNGVFVLTYDIGAEGLNLQGGTVVILVDYWWNDGKSKQAVARTVRRGQTLPVQIYHLTSDTVLEREMFNKHADKLTVADELEVGAIKSDIRSLKMDEILSLIVQGSVTPEVVFE